MKSLLNFFLLFSVWVNTTFCQNFIIDDTLCIGERVDITFTGNAEEFCVNSDVNFIGYPIIVDTILDYPENAIPLFSHCLKDNSGNHFCFVTNFTNNSLVRLEFGNNLLNDPVTSSIPIDDAYGLMEAVQILYEDNEWWGFITGGNGQALDEYLLRLYFGNSLNNIPTVENLGAIGNLSYPHDLFFIEEADQWMGITINKFNNTLTRFDFGDSLSNTPIATNLGNIGNINSPTGFFPIQVDGNWHLFVINEQGSLTRVDFGTSISDNPSGVNLGSLDILDRPRDILISKICDDFIGLVINRGTNEITLHNFGTAITGTPSSSTVNIESLAFPHSISELLVTDEGLVLFICNVDSEQVTRVLFQFPDRHMQECQEALSDIDLIYTEPGTYELQLIANDGPQNQYNYCKEVVVISKPTVDVYFPNVFSPNGDGTNDVYQVYFSGNYDIVLFRLEIYNRWGEKIFETNDSGFIWDGRFKNKNTMEGVYAYTCNFSYRNGVEEFVESRVGEITLVK